MTPSSKTVGDLAQFMVQNGLDESTVVDRAEELSFPSSVVEYFQGQLGEPPKGFPEPLRARVLKGKPTITGRPGESMPPLDFDKLRTELEERFENSIIRDVDVMSAAMYPQVFNEYLEFHEEFGSVSRLPTQYYFGAPEVGETVSFHLEQGKNFEVKLLAVGPLLESGKREVFFDFNGQSRSVFITDKKSAGVRL